MTGARLLTISCLLLQSTPESWNMDLGGIVLGSLILYLKGMRIMMFQLSGFYYKVSSLGFGVVDFNQNPESLTPPKS